MVDLQFKKNLQPCYFSSENTKVTPQSQKSDSVIF